MLPVKNRSKGVNVQAKRLLYYNGRKYGLLAQEARGVLVIQRVSKAGTYIHSPIRVKVTEVFKRGGRPR